MFTGIILYFLLKELGDVEGRKIYNLYRLENGLFIDVKDKPITVNLKADYTHLAIKEQKGEIFYPSIFSGKTVREIRQSDMDRLLEIETEDNYRIVFELFGRHSNCLLINQDKIIHSFPVNRRGKYTIPEPPEGENIMEVKENTLLRLIKNNEKILGLTPTFIKILNKKEEYIIQNFIKREFKPTIHEDLLSPYYLGEGETFSTMNDAVINFFTRKTKKESRESLINQKLKYVQNKINSKKKTIKEVKNIPEPEILKMKGEAILTNIKDMKKGMENIKLDYRGKNLNIELKPYLSPSDNAQRYFELYKKNLKKKKKSKGIVNQLRNELQKLKTIEEKLKSGEPVPRLKIKDSSKRKGASEKKSLFREFKTSNGFKVLVGKGQKSNHELTFHHSRPYDIFLHVKGAPGPHTILKLKDKNQEPPMKDIEEAAYYAARYSKMKHSKMVPVSYTERRYVRSGKKLPPGKVLLEREKVIYVNLT